MPNQKELFRRISEATKTRVQDAASFQGVAFGGATTFVLGILLGPVGMLGGALVGFGAYANTDQSAVGKLDDIARDRDAISRFLDLVANACKLDDWRDLHNVQSLQWDNLIDNAVEVLRRW